ncbi:putative tRNA pseudouridine synthase Pus10 [Coemansia sp. RSA 2704]|nr:putative tRNA pseudouridine synthase Pus10 [Coemansia sp. RSA 2704]
MADVVAACLESPGSTYQSADQVKDAAQALSQTGICTLCVLRYLPLELGHAYSTCSATNTLQELGVTGEPAEAPCPACLGILNYELADQIVDAYAAQQFDAQDAAVGVELPRSVFVRHRAMQLFCADRGIGRADAAVDVKDAFKHMVAQRLAAACGVTMLGDSPMRIDVTLVHAESAAETRFLGADESKTAFLSALRDCDERTFRTHAACPPAAPQTPARLGPVSLRRASLLIGGRYLKLERNVSQTPFIIEGRRVTEHSVSELIGAPLQKLTRCDSCNLVGSGREDADVRMLGAGRPFYIECINPRVTRVTPAQLRAVEESLGASPVRARLLQTIRPQDTAVIKQGEESKTKLYCALVWLAAPLDAQRLEEINQQGALVLQQKTPVRVLHRRAPLTRAKRVLRLELVHLEGRFYKLRVEAEAGTYIKEFVHGDLGRTVPSLAQMAGVPADILELDVENVSLDFPPPLPSS